MCKNQFKGSSLPQHSPHPPVTIFFIIYYLFSVCLLYNLLSLIVCALKWKLEFDTIVSNCLPLSFFEIERGVYQFSNLQGSFSFLLPGLSVQAYTTTAIFMWLLRMELGSSRLLGEHFATWTISSPVCQTQKSRYAPWLLSRVCKCLMVPIGSQVRSRSNRECTAEPLL